ncbi:permease-like cell division protein FtsX [Glycomyces sp. NPDC047010]|uniref:permease-like cell division protein FtsX n=1 Tax=Glycomyces sp. NPDC047010 TaxID=3155023 RepID=UPI00340EF2ED
MSTIPPKSKRPLGRTIAIVALCVGVAAVGALAYVLLRGDEATTPTFPGDHHVIVYLERDIEDDVLEQLESTFQEHPLVDEVQFESQAEALERFQDTFEDRPDLVDTVEADELPSAFRIKLTDPDRSAEFIAEFQDAEGVYEITDLMELYRYWVPACIEFEDKGIGPAEGDTESVLYEVVQACSSFGYDL